MAESADNQPGGASARARAFRFVEVLALAFLTGGLVTIGLVAQLAFNSPDILSREQAGRLLAEVFERSISFEMLCITALVFMTGLQRAWGRALVVFPVMVLLFGAHLEIAKSMRTIRLQHGGTTANLAADHPDRKQFGLYHGLYSAASLALLGCGVGLIGAHTLRKGT